MTQCRRIPWLFAACLVAGFALAGCTTMKKTFDTTPDPELQRPGVYPNINNAGAPQPGKLMTADELEKTKAALEAKGRAASPSAGATAKAEGEAQTKELDAVAKNHAADALKAIQNGCGTETPVDATKCPQ